MILWTSRSSHTYILLILTFYSYLYFAHTKNRLFGIRSTSDSQNFGVFERVQKEQLQTEILKIPPRNNSTDQKEKSTDHNLLGTDQFKKKLTTNCSNFFLSISSWQHKTRVHNEPSFFFYFLANPREISRFRNIKNGLVPPCFEGWTSPFPHLTTCLTTCGDFSLV